MTGIHYLRGVSAGCRSGKTQYLILTIGLIIGEIKTYSAVEECTFQAHLGRVGLLWLQVWILTLSRGCQHRVAIEGCLNVVHIGKQIRIGISTYLRPSASEFQIIHLPAGKAQCFVKQYTRRNGWIEVGIVIHRQRRRPVVATGETEISPVLVVDGDRTIHTILTEAIEIIG